MCNTNMSRLWRQEVKDSLWHTFTFLDTHYLYDVESGALHRIDQVSRVAGAFGVYSVQDIVELLATDLS